VTMLGLSRITEVFEAAVQVTEEAIINALVAAETMTGADGRVVEALSHARVRQAMATLHR
jgi:D-aminopeptidase